MPAAFVMAASVGGEDRGGETRTQLESLLLEGEEVLIATGGKGGGALFTNLRLILVEKAGMFETRALIRFIRAGAIDGAAIDATAKLTLQLVGQGFLSANLTFDGEVDATKLAHWCAQAMHS
ncbi:hypothetical protein [Porphyrobacter sp. GA68]|uniref:hypothetical protein n=1 Tax=Porphyrobacter sp. GA68 TaxID=2883480 RepID=UPI001D1957AE|nr:hypothetical protein [Porphyrobacter sp. GA68]